jgi:F-type H+-transporting ATPase subunit b
MSLSLVLAAAAATESPITVHLWTFIFQAINVLVVLGVLYWLLFRPLGSLMAKREQYVEDTLSEAAEKHAEAEKTLAQYEEQLKDVRSEAQAILDKSIREAEEYESRRRREAEAHYEEMIAKAKSDIEAERQRVLSDMRDEVVELALLAAGKVLGRAITEQDHRELARDFVRKMGEMQ